MRTIKLTIEYDGTAYCGWQVQPNGISIQEVAEGALARLLGLPVRLHSSGRTDAGVHAAGMVAAFATESAMPLTAFSDGLNALLPPDIAVREASEAEPGFNPRADAVGKHYRYTIFNGKRRSPLARLYTWHLRGGLDIGAMRDGGNRFCGEHDFAAFRTSGCAARTTVRRIDSVDIGRDGEFVVIDVSGSGFLRNMVRIMAGTLVSIGQGKLPPETVTLLLRGESPVPAGPTAPAKGLCLMEVFYRR